MSQTSPLLAAHARRGARLTSFAGWELPLRFGSELDEHRAVRERAGLFDLSHMGQITVVGPGAGAALDYALTATLSNLAIGRARYTMIVGPDGGVLDDLVVYRLADAEFVIVCNAANTAVVVDEMTTRAAGFDDVAIHLDRDHALIAAQGPLARHLVAALAQDGDALLSVRPFGCTPAVVGGHEVLVARTGYTGEDGFEVFVARGDAEALWEALLEAGTASDVVPCGLAARDTLRLEAAMPLYGHELSRQTTPFDAGWGRVVDVSKPGDWVGREALLAAAEREPTRRLVGLRAAGRRAAREGTALSLAAAGVVGSITSGCLSPTLGHPIALAYVEASANLEVGDHVAADVRGSQLDMELVPVPFYRRNPTPKEPR